MSAHTPFNRPGISDAFLAAAGCTDIDEHDCARLYGFKAAGIVIPFKTMRGEPILDGEKPFARVRLYHESDNQKYHQRRNSGVHIYVPPSFAERAKGSTLILIEGEFKALALDEAKCCALGLCGLTAAARTVEKDGGHGHELHEELVQLLETHRPATVVFAGDADVVLNSQFTAEAAKLRKLLCGDRKFSFVEKLLVAKPPIEGPKGIDDCRAAQGEKFHEWFDSLVADGLEIQTKATPVEIFCGLLRREKTVVQKMLTQTTGNSHRLRVRLLNSAAHLQHEPAAMLSLRPLVAEVLDIKESEVSGLIRDAAKTAKEKRQDESDGTGNTLQGTALRFSKIEPWFSSVSGPEILTAVSSTMSEYVSLPAGAADACALWCAHSHLFECFTCSPRLNFSSPEKGCGKTTARDTIALFVPRALLAENLTPAVLFRVIEQYQPTLLVDEADAWLRDNEELRGILNAGHRRGGQALRCEGENAEVRAFNVFAPIVICGIGTLPGTLHDRSIGIRLERAKEGEVRKRFDSRHIEHEIELARKLVRWCQDNRETIAACEPEMPTGVFNRVADNWRPLFAIARIAGGEWPDRAAAAFACLTGESDPDALGLSEMLLLDIRGAFAESGADRMFSKALVKALCDMSDRPWPEANKGRAVTENWLARRLRHFGLQSGSVRVGDETAKGYYLSDLEPIFTRYQPNGSSNRHTVTSPASIEEEPLLKASHETPCDGSEKTLLTNAGAGCDAVTLQGAGKAADVREQEVLL